MDSSKENLFKKSAAAKREKLGKFVTATCAAIIIACVLIVFLFVIFKGSWLFFHDHVKLSRFLFGIKWQVAEGDFGALPLLTGSVLVSLVSLLLAAPLALGIAIMLSEIVSSKLAKWLKMILEILVGIPAVVYGLLGMLLVVPMLRLLVGGTGYGWLAAAIVLAIMILPSLVSLSLDALVDVPDRLRLAAAALGADRFQIWQTIVFPLAWPRLGTALILAFAQSFGEAIAVQMVIGNATLFPTGINSPAATLTSVITIELGDAVVGSRESNALWALAGLLLVISLLFDLIAHYLIWRRKK
ncbi:phosphate ABC transporter permease subunit PstC [Liquorilactobacillus sicerae]|uniref:phosphate ABC transporter permease subunit PstC n=1 Tax=Liquorilactobacillus sicerae TaxID=1416943 RepID=UPI00247FF2C4|nr:phosphate ABC transporter permease subunit PstC [Liquorilactobacillus sicerae]